MIDRRMAAAIVAGLAGLSLFLGFGLRDSSAGQQKTALDFRLTGPHDKIYTRESFPSDAVLVVYFGYTTCWRACPVALNTVAQAVETLGDAGKKVYPIFVSLDSQRDTPDMVQYYASSFGPRFLGLSGSRDEVLKTAASFDVPVQNIRYSQDEMDYAMKHGSPILVWKPGKAEPVKLLATTTPPELRTALMSS